MDFFDELYHEEPKGICLHECTGEILEFVRSHFGRLLMARSKGYSWRQIARAVEARAHFRSNNLIVSLRGSFSKVKKERTAKAFLKSLSEENNYVS